MAVTTAISDLIHFFYESIASVFSGIYSIIHGLISTITGLFSGILHVIGDAISGVGTVISSITSFIAGNIILLSVGAVLAFFFLRSTATGQRALQKGKTA